jgi:hypothetical protein
LEFHRILGIAAILVLASAHLPADTGRGVGITAGEPGSSLKVGKQYLAVIAIGKYQQWPPLSRPVEDAKEIRDILLSRYCIDRVYELYDEQATKANILKLFVKLQAEIQIDDSLLILYAGHGHLDKSSSTGFWIPVNAGTDRYEQQNWLPHTQLRGLFSNIRAIHLFVISDSCFAGDLIQATRSMPSLDNADYFQKAYSRVSRQVLTSGATEAVPDVSDFAGQLKSILQRNRSPYLDTFMLYNEIRLGVGSTIPLLGALAGTGHQEGASFLLFLKPGLEAPQEKLSVEEQRIAIHPGAAQPAEIEGARKRRNFFSCGLESGPVFPVAAVAGALGTGPYLWSSVHYNISLDWGAIGIGLLAGAMAVPSGDSQTYGYNMRSFPLAVEGRYQTAFDSPIYLSAGIAAGAALSLIGFNDETADGVTTLKVFIAPSLGIGLRIFNHFRIAAGLNYQVIFFDNTAFSGISPGIRVEYAFH